jgi:putative ABC transport system ATP-binding protein
VPKLPESTLVLDVQDLHFHRDPSRSANSERGFSLHLPRLALGPGSCVGLVGPSGCGKSTLLDLLALLRRPRSAGRFALLGRDVLSLWASGGTDACTALRAAAIGVVLQTGGLLSYLPVRENVALSQTLLGTPDRAWIDHLLGALDLQPLARRLPGQLSIGQRQRVAVARALAHRPALVLADEPTASLGADHGPAALDLLLDLSRSTGAAVVIVSHDIGLLRSRGVPLMPCHEADASIVFEAHD